MRNIIGVKFGRLTAIKEYESRRRNPSKGSPKGKLYRRFICQCECGVEKVINYDDLCSGNTKSCGCLKIELISKRQAIHKKCNTPEYTVWRAMRGRCNTPTNKKYANYGGRGITVCKRWGTFENFYNDMSPRPEGASIDRIDNDGNYKPTNCRWATPREQQRNRSNNTLITHKGKTQCLSAWTEEVGMPTGVIRKRLKRGWSTERALMEPLHTR